MDRPVYGMAGSRRKGRRRAEQADAGHGIGKGRNMEEYTQITLAEWMSWKEDIRRKLQETAGNFVHIGYRLKQIRDSGMYDGCQDIFEFAQKEYGLSKSTVSRFIAINEKFSEGGNSLELRAEFRGIGSSKLSEMLTLPDADCALITERTTVKEIRELKEFNRQELPEDALAEESEEPVATSQQDTGDIVNTKSEADPEAPEKAAGKQENTAHRGNDNVARTYTPLQKCIIDFFGSSARRQALCQIMDILTGEVTEEDLKDAAEAVNPGDYCTHKKGLVFLFLYDWNQGVKYKLMTAPEPISMSWPEFLREIQDIYLEAYEKRPEDVWAEFYEKPEQTPEKPEQMSEKPEQKEKGNVLDGQGIERGDRADGENRRTEEHAGDSEGAGKEPEGQQDDGGQEAEAAPEGEAAGDVPAGEGLPAGREASESCCDAATESPGDIVNTKAEADPDKQGQQDIWQMLESEKKYREQIMDMAAEVQACVHKAGEEPMTMQEVRRAHAAARKMLTALDRLYDVKEHEIGEIEGQMSLEDMGIT